MVVTASSALPLELELTVAGVAAVGAGPAGGSEVSTMTAPDTALTGGVALDRVSIHRSAMERAVC
jgi:hypothetical protein